MTRADIRRLFDAMQAQGGEYLDEDLDFIETRLETFPKYMNAVIKHVVGIERAKAEGKSGEDFRYVAETLDRSRKITHDAAIAACDQINRMCKAYGVEPICNVDTGDRLEVAKFIGETVVSLYNDGLNKVGDSFDDIVDVHAHISKGGELFPTKREA